MAGVPGRGDARSSSRIGAADARPRCRRRRRCPTRELEVLRLAADGLTNDEIADGAHAERPDGRAAPLERLPEARPLGRGRSRGGGRATSSATRLSPPSCVHPAITSRVEPSRIAWYRRRDVAARPHTVASTSAAVAVRNTRRTVMRRIGHSRHEERVPRRSGCGEGNPHRHGHARERARAPERRAVQLGGRSASGPGRRATSRPARPPTCSGRSPAAASSSCATRSPRSSGIQIDDVSAVASCATDARGLLGMSGAVPDLGDVQLEIQITLARTARADRPAPAGLGGALPDLPGDHEAERRGAAPDRRGGRDRVRVDVAQQPSTQRHSPEVFHSQVSESGLPSASKPP